MITGFNTDIDHEGRIFHVQTEDKGVENPVIESLIYSRGEIIDSRRASYAELAAGGSCPEDEVLQRMESQHQALIREIRNGRYDPEGPKPFGHSIISGRSLDEVVFEFLTSGDRLEGLALQVFEEQVLQQGTRPALRLRVVERGTLRAVSNAQVDVRLVSTHHEPRLLCSAASNEDGLVEAAFELPEAAGADLAVVCRASAAGQQTEIRQFVHRANLRRASAERA